MMISFCYLLDKEHLEDILYSLQAPRIKSFSSAAFLAPLTRLTIMKTWKSLVRMKWESCSPHWQAPSQSLLSCFKCKHTSRRKSCNSTKMLTNLHMSVFSMSVLSTLHASTWLLQSVLRSAGISPVCIAFLSIKNLSTHLMVTRKRLPRALIS